MGQEGVKRALEVIHKELDISMALCGKRRIEELTRDVLLVPEGFEGRWQP
jgi:L-lactate dehydrogenase (cytochrome)